MIPTDREVGFQTEALLPSSYYQRHDRPPTEESDEQVRSHGTINLVGCRAQ